MISSTTLILATLVFNAAAVLGAPIRIPSTAPEVVVRASVAQPVIPRAAVIDAQPVRKRSAEGTANRPRLAREVVPEHETRDTASESVEMRDSSLPEVENIVRRFPRRHLAEFYERRSPEPAPAPGTPSAPSSQPHARSDPAPPIGRRFPRQPLFERHEQRSTEPVPPLEVRNEYDPDGHFVREHNPELMAKRDALPTDNVPREPEPAPKPAPAENSEKVRRFPRRVYADHYAKRQDTQDPPSPVTSSTATPSSTSSTSAPTGTTTTSASSSTTAGLPASLEKAIADAIVKGSNNPATGGSTAGKTSTYSDTTITIKITHQANSDVKPEKQPKGSPNPPPTSTSSSATSTPTSTGTASSSASSGSPTGGPATPPAGTPTGSTADDSTDKPKEESKPEATGTVSSPSGSPDGGEGPAQPDAEPRDLGDSDAADKPLSKRKLGLSGALWASWSRRNFQKD